MNKKEKEWGDGWGKLKIYQPPASRRQRARDEIEEAIDEYYEDITQQDEGDEND